MTALATGGLLTGAALSTVPASNPAWPCRPNGAIVLIAIADAGNAPAAPTASAPPPRRLVAIVTWDHNGRRLTDLPPTRRGGGD
jgi:hypothetical protein